MNELCLGQLVMATAGRDKGKLFVVLCINSDQYVYISDGSIRRVENPKKKKLKHLKKLMNVSGEDCFQEIISNDIKNKLHDSQKVNNSEIKKFIKSVERIKNRYREQEV
jgi:ribosomal protein L14E/L6E/L27E